MRFCLVNFGILQKNFFAAYTFSQQAEKNTGDQTDCAIRCSADVCSPQKSRYRHYSSHHARHAAAYTQDILPPAQGHSGCTDFDSGYPVPKQIQLRCKSINLLKRYKAIFRNCVLLCQFDKGVFFFFGQISLNPKGINLFEHLRQFKSTGQDNFSIIGFI